MRGVGGSRYFLLSLSEYETVLRRANVLTEEKCAEIPFNVFLATNTSIPSVER